MGEAENKKTPQEGHKELNQQTKGPSEDTGGMLSSTDFLRLVILDNVEQAKKAFWRREFSEYKRKFIITPFNPERLTPFSYDLSVGEEVYSCNKDKVIELKNEDDSTYWVHPRETIVIKTAEFIALPPCYSATVWPRFKMPAEAIFQSMVKIDPTWYGELGVSITNLSSGSYPIELGSQFATLVIYELKTETGMFLFRKENLPEPDQIQIATSVNLARVQKNLNDNNLLDVCEIINNKIRLKKRPNTDDLEKLFKMEPSGEWRDAVIKCIGSFPRKMDGLGLTTLELIRPKPPKVKSLTRGDISKTTCTETDLENIAIEHGIPFNVLAAIPEMIMEKIKRDVAPRIRAEVEANIFPKTVTLTLTVLGFLSLIVAISAFVMDKYRPGSPEFMAINWPLTSTIISVLLAIILLWAIYRLMHQKSDESQTVRRLERTVEDLKKRIEQHKTR